MNLASDGAGRETVISSGGMVVGRLPCVASTRLGGLRVIGMPALSHVLGPALAPAQADGAGMTTLKQFGLISDLLALLPRASHVSFRLHPGVTDTLAFAAAGFLCDAEFTVRIAAAPCEQLRRQMRDKTRNVYGGRRSGLRCPRRRMWMCF